MVLTNFGAGFLLNVMPSTKVIIIQIIPGILGTMGIMYTSFSRIEVRIFNIFLEILAAIFIHAILNHHIVITITKG